MEKTKFGDMPAKPINVSPLGDVVLIIGTEKARLRVNSPCLVSSSKVFATMFSRWPKGEGLSKEHSKEVPLVEDDADAIRIICCVIHHRNDIVPQSFTPREVLQIAIVADKYDFWVALKYAMVQWLQPGESSDVLDMGYLMAAAFVFGDMELFVVHTMNLILHHSGSYVELVDNAIINHIVPSKTFCKYQA